MAAHAGPPPDGLGRALQNWVGWGAGAHEVEGAQALQAQKVGAEGYEVLLRKQNAGNDELCSENGRLRAEIERLRHEEQDLGIGDLGGLEAMSAGGNADADGLEDELCRSVIASIEVLLSNLGGERTQEAAGEAVQGAEAAEGGCAKPEATAPGIGAAGGDALTDAVAAPDAAAPAGAAATAGEEALPEGVALDAEALAAGSAMRGRQLSCSVVNGVEFFDMAHDELDDEEEGFCPDIVDAEAPAKEEAIAWKVAILEAVPAAIRAAMREELESSTPAPALTPAEETAVLVGEKIALRELVERQQDRIAGLEKEMGLAPVALPPAGGPGAERGAVGVVAQRISNVGGSLSAGLSAALATKEAAKKAVVATVGAEYEVVGRSGAIVREGESLTSKLVSDLRPGARVRVVAISDTDPRRVEIVACRFAAQLCEEEEPDPGGGDPGGSPAKVDELVHGWISAVSNKGHSIILRAECQEVAGGEGAGGSEAEAGGGEEGQEEVKSVTLSTKEWECLHQDQESAMRRIEALSSRLNAMGCELLQSFEMKSVLGEMQHGVQRAQERCARMREAAAMSVEELEARRCELRGDEAHLACADLEERRSEDGSYPVPDGEEGHGETDSWQSSANGGTTAAGEPHSAPSEDSTVATAVTGSGGATASTATPATSVERQSSGGVGFLLAQALKPVDLEVLASERETTAAALSTALQRLSCLEREADELREERLAAENRMLTELGPVRTALRRLAAPTVAAMSRAAPALFGGGEAASSQDSEAGAAAEGLFRRRVDDLQRTVAELREELRRAAASEQALRHSVAARSSALRRLLCRGATAQLIVPQCGPIRLPASADAEREALREAVQQQLTYNLRLQGAALAPAPGAMAAGVAADPHVTGEMAELLAPPVQP